MSARAAGASAAGGAGASSSLPAASSASQSLNGGTGLMLFLRSNSTSLVDELTRRLAPDFRPTNTLDCDAHITDLDEVHYRLRIPEANHNDVSISMVMPAWKDLKAACAVEEHLRGVYGSMVVAPDDGSDFALKFDASTIPPERLAEVIESVSSLRRNAMAAPFEAAFRSVAIVKAGAGAAAAAAAMAASPPAPEMMVRFHGAEPTFILARPDKVLVTFVVAFADPTDRAIARTIATEFVEATRTVVGTPVSFSDKAAPLELAARAVAAPAAFGEALVGYMTFAIFPRQFDTEPKRAKAINLLTQFRPYLDYHIKAGKAHLHARMRARVDGWMQVLNRAILEDPFAVREKKLMSGKTMKSGGFGGAAAAVVAANRFGAGGAGGAGAVVPRGGAGGGEAPP